MVVETADAKLDRFDLERVCACVYVHASVQRSCKFGAHSLLVLYTVRGLTMNIFTSDRNLKTKGFPGLRIKVIYLYRGKREETSDYTYNSINPLYYKRCPYTRTRNPDKRRAHISLPSPHTQGLVQPSTRVGFFLRSDDES